MDILPAEKGGLCLFLEEECCFYVNKLDIVRKKAKNLPDRALAIQQYLASSWTTWLTRINWFSWLLPFVGSLVLIIAALIFGPCLLNLLIFLVSSHLEAIKLQMILQMEP